MLFFNISVRLSKGDESREEKRMAGSDFGESFGTVVIGGRVDGEELFGGLLDISWEDDCRIDV